jgi:hypothetical protein
VDTSKPERGVERVAELLVIAVDQKANPRFALVEIPQQQTA